MSFDHGAKQVVLPPGRYVIGDPCYHIPADEWDEVLVQSGFFEKQCWANFQTAAGLQSFVVAFSTAFGDGVYEDGAHRKYPVDAGLIGIIPLEAVGYDLDLSCAHVLDFKAPFTCREREGVITFGYIDINTDDEGEDDEDAYEDDERISRRWSLEDAEEDY